VETRRAPKPIKRSFPERTYPNRKLLLRSKEITITRTKPPGIQFVETEQRQHYPEIRCPPIQNQRQNHTDLSKYLQRNISHASLAGWLVAFVLEQRKSADEFGSCLRGLDHFVDKAALGGDVRTGELVF